MYGANMHKKNFNDKTPKYVPLHLTHFSFAIFLSLSLFLKTCIINVMRMRELILQLDVFDTDMFS